jgi:predicted RNase H-like HicB family nuclease
VLRFRSWFVRSHRGNTSPAQSQEWFIAFCPELREAYGQGKTGAERLASLAAAIEVVLD